MRKALRLLTFLVTNLAAAQQVISVEVCNVVCPRQTVAQAEEQASFVMKSAGLEIEWRACGALTPRPRLTPREFVLTFADYHPDHRSLHADASILAATWLEGSRTQNNLVVYYSAAKRFAEGHHEEDQVHVILGYAIAHEFGHQFMGAEHNPFGVMKAGLTTPDLVSMKQCVLRFTREERQIIQNALRARDSLLNSEIARTGR